MSSQKENPQCEGGLLIKSFSCFFRKCELYLAIVGFCDLPSIESLWKNEISASIITSLRSRISIHWSKICRRPRSISPKSHNT